ncbi:MAG: TetR/AcrR family transcriptional regulator [Acholeplasmatales bacterium]|jgi:AcrR family transcriptional regulator|nr:TetR/AcrR family transcriptional regulator [Acholeplasmatales bacterium]
MSTHQPERVDGITTYNRIIKTAKSLFSKKGFHATSTNEIILKAKIATGTFYQYFDSKRDLYNYLVKDYRTRIFKTIKESITNYTKREDIEYYGIKAYLDFVIKDRLAYKIIWESLFVDEEFFFNYYVTFARKYAQQLALFSDVNQNIDLEVMSFVLIGISNFVGIELLSKKNPLEIDTNFYVEEILKILRKGIFSESH